MRRTSLIWLTLGCCVLITLGAMAWISWQAVRLEQAHQTAAKQALLEENVRLALWRMESRLTPLIAVETSRPYFHYRAFYSPMRAYVQMLDNVNPADVMIPSPLLDNQPTYVLLHFHVQPDGTILSPQAPAGMDRQRAMAEANVDPQRLTEQTSQLNQLKSWMNSQALQTQLTMAQLQHAHDLTVDGSHDIAQAQPQTQDDQRDGALPGSARQRVGESQDLAQAPNEIPGSETGNIFRQLDAQQVQQKGQALQQARGGMEYRQRQYNVRMNADNTMNYGNLGQGNLLDGAGMDFDTIHEGVMVPLWHGDDAAVDELQLLLVRVVQINGQRHTQGAWLDWPQLRDDLLAGIHDLLPHATLEPALNTTSHGEPDRLLAAIPVRLIPGDTPGPLPHAAGSTAGTAANPAIVSLFLIIAWTCLLLAIVAVIVLMLAEGMVREPDKQRQYLATLRREAQRLGHMVENVLSYARLERGRARDQWQDVTVSQLIEHMRSRLADRAEQANMQLCINDLPDELAARKLRVKLTSVEQILFNLVDNACKYAADAEDRRIHLNVQQDDDAVTLTVSDHGPGIATKQLGRLFKPFNKSAHDAAHSAPGIGLGLALSKRLARDMNARLEHDHQSTRGARFILRLLQR